MRVREVSPAVDRTQQRLPGRLRVERIEDDLGGVSEVVAQQMGARICPVCESGMGRSYCTTVLTWPEC